jgi:hypothetical protein
VGTRRAYPCHSLTRALEGRTPFEAWYGRKPAVKHLRTFGCIAYAKITKPGLKKLDDCSVKTVFIGYDAGSKAYRLYDPIGDRVIISRDVAFDEAVTWDWSGEHGGGEDDPLSTCRTGDKGIDNRAHQLSTPEAR